MPAADPSALHHTLVRLFAEALRDPRLASEVARARREFFGPGATAGAGDLGEAAQVRFAEWYLLERESELLGETPLVNLTRRLASLGSILGALRTSMVGVFVVEEVGAPALLRDLQGRATHALEVPAELPLALGDIVVGRLFQTGGSWVPSAAVAVQSPGRSLAKAFQRDLARLGLERRLTQAEIEHLLFRGSAAAMGEADAQPLEHLEAELAAMLQSAGRDDLDAAELSQRLAAAPVPGRVLGPLLDDLAFHSDIDLEQARRLLLAMWNAQHEGEDAAPSVPARADRTETAPTPVVAEPGEGLGAFLARRIEQGLANSEDLDDLFGEVDEMLEAADDEDDDGDDDGEDDAAAIGEQGELDALIAEFAWEENCAGSDDERWLRAFAAQQRDAPVPHLEVEFLEPTDVLRLLLHVYLQAPPAQRAEEVGAAWHAVRRFLLWAQKSQSYDLQAVVDTCQSVFVDQLDRLHRASLALSGGESLAVGRGSAAALYRLATVAPDGVELLPSGAGVPLWVAPMDSRDLREGDLVLGAFEPIAAGNARATQMVIVLPREAEALLGL